jgi:hypothetical protein
MKGLITPASVELYRALLKRLRDFIGVKDVGSDTLVHLTSLSNLRDPYLPPNLRVSCVHRLIIWSRHGTLWANDASLPQGLVKTYS